ncbi:MAG: hypothetical protein PHI50_00375 [Alphaproteobacteria bacterium]|nr:hypothetical protein [Alphaproteobacteria bacterium]
MKKTALLLPMMLLASCSSFKPDFVVTDASEGSVPSWISQKKAYKSETEDTVKDYKYYVNDAENTNRRLCLRSANVRATQKIAEQIAQEIVSNYEEDIDSNNDISTTAIKSHIEQNIKVSLHGVSAQDSYWEKRAYKKELGAKKDYQAYKCNVVVKIKKANLIEALEAYKAKDKAMTPALKKAIDKTAEEIKED